MRERKVLVVRSRKDDEKVYFLKLQHGLISKLIRLVRVVYGRSSIKWTSRKGNNMLVKID